VSFYADVEKQAWLRCCREFSM